MRESLTYGSVRGVARKGHSYRDREEIAATTSTTADYASAGVDFAGRKRYP